MMYTVNVTIRARLDMREIYEYISHTLLAPETAEKQYTRIETAVYSLEQMPERFRQYEKEPWQSRNLRIMPVDNYIVFYTVDNENRVVSAIRIMYGRRNTEKELDDMAQQDY